MDCVIASSWMTISSIKELTFAFCINLFRGKHKYYSTKYCIINYTILERATHIYLVQK